MRLLRLAAINAAVLLLLLLVALGAAEAYLRFTVPESSSESIFQYTLETKRYKLMRPDAEIVAWGKPLRTNRLGFRDNDSDIPPKQPGEFRIVVIGDSFTVSAGVEYERIYTTLLESMLQQRYPGVKVINLAVAGYNVLQYELVLHEVALALGPDLVLVSVFPTNDFSNETLEANYRRARGEPEPPKPAFPRSLHVWQAWLGRVEAKVASLFQGEVRPAKGDSGWADNIAALGRIAEAARERKLPLLVATLPHTWNFTSQRPMHDRVQRYCAEHAIPCFNALEAFIAARVKEAALRLNPLDSHPNEAYNLIAARALAGRLEQGLVHPARAADASQVSQAR
ncbi:MAG TPA: SGNH/GDSL hydrolase family protein [Burkholderiales bacterium]|nr:SGNH/GDSL hydrolase family protein [Burkholderiales bacterium]